MLPQPCSRPPWLALRLLAVGAVLGCGLLIGHGGNSRACLKLVAGLPLGAAENGQTSLAGLEMFSRTGLTLALVAAAVLLAGTTASAAVFLSRLAGRSALALLGWMGRLLAFFPVIVLAWWALGWLVGEKGWPIASLLPFQPAPGRQTWEMLAASRLWLWMLPLWILVVPLLGLLVSEFADALRLRQDQPLRDALRARGVPRSWMHYRHIVPQIWPRMLDALERAGLLAMGYAVFVEEPFELRGWGAFFSHSLQTPSVPGIASAIYACGWMAAVWCGLAALIRRLTLPARHPAIAEPATPGAAVPTPAAGAGASPPAGATALLILTVTLLTTGFRPGDAWTFSHEWLEPLLPGLVADLREVGLACALALGLALLRGGIASVAADAARMPQLGMLELVEWAPLLAWAAGLAVVSGTHLPAWILLGTLGACGGAAQLRDRWRRLKNHPAVESARVVGASRFRAWRVHVLPALSRWLLGWVLQLAGVILLWLVLVRCLLPPAGSPSLADAIRHARDSILSDPWPVLLPGTVVAVVASALQQIGRWISGRAGLSSP